MRTPKKGDKRVVASDGGEKFPLLKKGAKGQNARGICNKTRLGGNARGRLWPAGSRRGGVVGEGTEVIVSRPGNMEG